MNNASNRISTISSPCLDFLSDDGSRLANSSETSVRPAMLELATWLRGSSKDVLFETRKARCCPVDTNQYNSVERDKFRPWKSV
jgi:hypothetical protein